VGIKDTNMVLQKSNNNMFVSFLDYSLEKNLTEEIIMNHSSGNQEMGSWPIPGAIGPTRRNPCCTTEACHYKFDTAFFPSQLAWDSS
jgi:hypothetical protein